MRTTRGFKDRYWLHALLFLLTLASTVLSGAEMAGRYLIYDAAPALFYIGPVPISGPFVLDGLRFGGSLLLFLTVHEFGHYVAARLHRVAVSLPYYIPFPFNGIGTFGAVIRIREQVPSLRKLFDIGIAGPLAGFVVAFGVLLVGFLTLPDLSYVDGFPGHDALKEWILRYQAFPALPLSEGGGDELMTLTIGTTPLYWILSQFFQDVPPMWEMYHYPILFAGWLGLFFTALNLLPVGQLDGGHILYALVGPIWHRRIARAFVLVLLWSGSIGFITEIEPALAYWDVPAGQASWLALSLILFLYARRIFNRNGIHTGAAVLGLTIATALGVNSAWIVDVFAYSGWLIWCLLIILLIRVEHPPVVFMEPLTPRRKAMAICSLVIFALCFSFKPLYIG
ncbi:MAG: site-2 protease family protein [Rhodothermales bacterium]